MNIGAFPRRAAALVLLAALLTALIPPVSAATDGTLWSTEPINEYSMWFNDHVLGLRLMVQSDMEIDASLSGLRTVLRNRDYSIEIYEQPLNGVYFDAYVNYSNRFALGNSPDYMITGKDTVAALGSRARLLEWNRPALSRVDGDKCYYAAADILRDDGTTLFILFKSTQPLGQPGGKYHMRVLNTLSEIPRSAAPAAFRSRVAGHPRWNVETRRFFRERFGENAGLSWGIFEPGVPDEYSQRFRDLEGALGFQFPILLRYSNFGQDNAALGAMLRHAAEERRTVELTLQTVPAPDGGNMVLDVLDGQYDDWLAEYAGTVAQSRHPVLFRLGNEMNGDWCVYSGASLCRDPELYVRFYRYVYDIFRRNGALANTIWVWNPNERSYPDYTWNHALCYYPGDTYVDVVGLTGYNNGDYYAETGEHWRSFGEIYDGLCAQYDAWFAQPLMITEFSCSSLGGDKAAWVADMREHIGSYPRLRAAVWWDGCDFDTDGTPARPYYIDDVPGVTELFREYFSHVRR